MNLAVLLMPLLLGPLVLPRPPKMAKERPVTSAANTSRSTSTPQKPATTTQSSGADAEKQATAQSARRASTNPSYILSAQEANEWGEVADQLKQVKRANVAVIDSSVKLINPATAAGDVLYMKEMQAMKDAQHKKQLQAMKDAQHKKLQQTQPVPVKDELKAGVDGPVKEQTKKEQTPVNTVPQVQKEANEQKEVKGQKEVKVEETKADLKVKAVKETKNETAMKGNDPIAEKEVKRQKGVKAEELIKVDGPVKGREAVKGEEVVKAEEAGKVDESKAETVVKAGKETSIEKGTKGHEAIVEKDVKSEKKIENETNTKTNQEALLVKEAKTKEEVEVAKELGGSPNGAAAEVRSAGSPSQVATKTAEGDLKLRTEDLEPPVDTEVPAGETSKEIVPPSNEQLSNASKKAVDQNDIMEHTMDNSKANTTSSPEPTGTSIGERPSPLPAVNLIAPVETAENATVVADIETDERPVPVSAKCSSTPRTADEMVLESIQPQPQANLDNLAEETSDLEPTKHMHDTPSMLNEKDAGLEAMLLRLDQLAAKWIVVEDHINAKREQAERRKAERKKAVQERAALQDVPGISHPTTASNAGAEVIEMVGDGEVKLLKTEMEVPASQKAEAVEAPGSDTDLLKATELTRELNSSSNPMWADFIKCRDRLLQEAVTDSILMGNFNDAEIHAYSQKSKHGTVSIPIVVHAKTSFLEASSPILKELSRAENRTARFIPTIASDYDYEDDSDLEDIEDDSDLEDIEDDDRDSEISDIASNASSFDILLDSAEHLPQASREGDARVEDPSGPQKTDSPVIFMHDVAAKTWQALLLYLYNDQISFASLKSRSSDSQSPNTCSPKSMYRLAKRLELDELRKLSESAIINDISADNIVEELFSDFTRRYPDILAHEVDVFTKYASRQIVRDKLNETLKDVARGRLPHREIVLAALFDHVLPPMKH